MGRWTRPGRADSRWSWLAAPPDGSARWREPARGGSARVGASPGVRLVGEIISPRLPANAGGTSGRALQWRVVVPGVPQAGSAPSHAGEKAVLQIFYGLRESALWFTLLHFWLKPAHPVLLSVDKLSGTAAERLHRHSAHKAFRLGAQTLSLIHI